MKIDKTLEELDAALANMELDLIPHEAQELLLERLDKLVESLARELRRRGALE